MDISALRAKWGAIPSGQSTLASLIPLPSPTALGAPEPFHLSPELTPLEREAKKRRRREQAAMRKRQGLELAQAMAAIRALMEAWVPVRIVTLFCDQHCCTCGSCHRYSKGTFIERRSRATGEARWLSLTVPGLLPPHLERQVQLMTEEITACTFCLVPIPPGQLSLFPTGSSSPGDEPPRSALWSFETTVPQPADALAQTLAKANGIKWPPRPSTEGLRSAPRDPLFSTEGEPLLRLEDI